MIGRVKRPRNLIAIYEQHGGTYGAGLKYQQTLVAGKGRRGSRKRADFKLVDDAFADASRPSQKNTSS